MHILVVDDDQAVRDSLARSLHYSGWEVTTAGDGIEALARLSAMRPDAVIMDVMMPRLDGLEATRSLRASGNDVPILVLTARDAVGDRVDGLDAGADDYLVKPFALEEAMARVRALIRRRFGKRSNIIRVGDLEIDISAREVKRDGGAVDLTAKEFSLLELLAMRAGEVVSRGDVWEQLYDFSFERGNSNVVDVFVSNLRKKIDVEGKPSFIQTRRGQGYVLRENR
ncbi:MAG: response regulator transcription factor [Salinibacterium sp.]|nr:response regulator transcription factor [Salinibacterium sp.]